MKTTSSEKLRLSMAGEYGVCAELCKRGFDVNFTLGNTKAVDIFVHFDNGSYKRIEVKTTRGNVFVTGFFQKYYDRNRIDHPDLWILVYIDIENISHFYILTHEEMGNVQMKRNMMTQWGKIKGCDNVTRSSVLEFENNWEKI